MKISFVIPCYNTGKIIYEIIDEIEQYMKNRSDGFYEIILVNDASPLKETLDILKDVVNKRKNIILVDLVKNSGQPNAIIAGCRIASGDYIMTSDDDGQTPLSALDSFFEKLNEGYDVVCARYTVRERKSVFRAFGSIINKKMSDFLIPRPDNLYMSTIFLARKYVIDEVIKYDQPYAYISGLLLRVTQNIANVDVKQKKRNEGKSGYTVKKLVSLWLNGFTAFSIKPLRLADIIGGIFALSGMVMAIVTVIRRIMYNDIIQGWSSLMAMMLVSSGLTLVVLGIIGEYIGRIYMCINKTPQSVIKAIYKSKE